MANKNTPIGINDLTLYDQKIKQYIGDQNQNSSSVISSVGLDKTLLWSGTLDTLSQTGTLSDDFNNYEYLVCYYAPPEHPKEFHLTLLDCDILSNALTTNEAYFSYEYYDTGYIRFRFTSTKNFIVTELNKSPASAAYLRYIYGINFSTASGSGGGTISSNNYSTSEQKIGTWIDGSDLYAITLVHTETSFSSGDFIYIDEFPSGTNLDKRWIHDGFIYESEGGYYPIFDPGQNYIKDIWSRENLPRFTLTAAKSGTNVTFCITVYYTKKTTNS